MAKAIKAKRAQFYALNQLLAKIPKQSMEEGSLKINGFFRAVKKVLRKHLDEIAELNKVKMKKIEEETKEYQELQKQLNALEKSTAPEAIQKQADIREQISAVDFRAGVKTEAETKRLKEIEDEMNGKEVEAVFDNEDFIFIETIFKKTPALFSYEDKGGKERFDLDTMDAILTLFENAYVPKE